MKIIIATDNYPPRYDGISRFLKEVIPALAKDHEVHVIAPDFGPTEDPWTITKIPVTRMRVGDFHPAGLHLIKIMRAMRGYDTVFIQTLGSIGAMALIAAKLMGKKIVLYTHSIEWELVPRALGGQILRRILPNIIKLIDRIVYSWINLLLIPSTNISENYYWNKIDTKRIIINLGVDVKTFAPAKDKKAAKKKLGIAEEELVIGYHGRLAREKDLRTLLRGWISFRSRNPNRKTRLLIVGDGLREIREMLDREGVIITGFQEDVVPLLHAMDIYCLTSLTETSCLSVMEAMSCGLPVIATPVGYVKDYIQDKENGLFVQEKNPVALTMKIEELLDEKTREALGTKARETIQEKFSWDATREQILDVFNRL